MTPSQEIQHLIFTGHAKEWNYIELIGSSQQRRRTMHAMGLNAKRYSLPRIWSTVTPRPGAVTVVRSRNQKGQKDNCHSERRLSPVRWTQFSARSVSRSWYSPAQPDDRFCIGSRYKFLMSLINCLGQTLNHRNHRPSVPWLELGGIACSQVVSSYHREHSRYEWRWTGLVIDSALVVLLLQLDDDSKGRDGQHERNRKKVQVMLGEDRYNEEKWSTRWDEEIVFLFLYIVQWMQCPLMGVKFHQQGWWYN